MKYLFFLDYLRIFGLVSVFIAHKFSKQLKEALSDPSLQVIPEPILAILDLLIEGGAGVVVFFLVSGYVITFVLYNGTTAEFLIKRAFRIYPLYIFALLAHNGLSMTQDPTYQINFFHLIPQLLLLGDFFQTPYALAGVEWTLRVEIIFYLFMAGIRHWMPNGLNITWFFPLLFVSVIFCVLALTLCALFLSNGPLNLFLAWPLVLLGSVFYLFEVRLIGLYGLIAFILFLFSFLLLLVTVSGIENTPHLWYALIGISLFVLSWRFQKNFPGNKVILFLSQLTYAIYLFHNWLFDHFKDLSGSTWAALALLIITCYLSHLLVEKPSFVLGNKLAQKWREKAIEQ